MPISGGPSSAETRVATNGIWVGDGAAAGSWADDCERDHAGLPKGANPGCSDRGGEEVLLPPLTSGLTSPARGRLSPSTFFEGVAWGLLSPSRANVDVTSGGGGGVGLVLTQYGIARLDEEQGGT